VQVQNYQDAIANLQQVGKLLGESETAATAANKFLDQNWSAIKRDRPKIKR